MAKALSLLKAYHTSSIPSNGGFIVTAYFEGGTNYSVYEVTAYQNVKDIYQVPEGMIFKTDGNRTHMLIEPPSYAQKHIEPVNREQGKSIPYRFNEMNLIKLRNQVNVMIPKEPIMLYSSFTILKNRGDSFSFVFHLTEDVYLAMKKFISDSLYNDCSFGKTDAMTCAKTVLETIKKFSIWKA